MIFFRDLWRLLRQGETNTLELVMGLLGFTIGLQFFLGLLNLTNTPALLNPLPFPFEFIVSLGLIFLSLLKIVGAVEDVTQIRRYSALAMTSIWYSLIVANVGVLTPFSFMFLFILASQSTWIYTRLSILRKSGYE